MSHCCPTAIKIVLPPPACPDSGTYTASNANLIGEGVFLQQTGNDFEFIGITNTDGYLTITKDLVNNVLVVNIDEDLISGSIPDATETVKGKAELATQAETNAGADDTRIVTPLKLNNRTASTTQTGIVELATVAESIAGTDSTRAVTPEGLKGATDLLQGTLVAANSVARGGITPGYAGQLLFQQDTEVLYAAQSTTMGDFDLAAIPRSGNCQIGTLRLSVGTIIIDAGAGIEMQGPLNFETDTDLQIMSTSIPPYSLLGTDADSGIPFGHLISNFLSTYNTEIYSLGTYTANSRAILDSGTITLPQLADVVATLISDMANNKKPYGGV